MPNLLDFTAFEMKPDLAETRRRYDAFWNGDLLDRPIVLVTAQNPDYPGGWYHEGYYERIHSDLDALVAGIFSNAGHLLYLGEALPTAYLSFGCDEVAAFCGGELLFHGEGDQRGTCWSKPFVDNWKKPVALVEDHPLWLRMQSLLDKFAAAARGKLIFHSLDLHTNADLLLAMRGAEGLCTDLVDCPEMVDRAMEQTMAVFDRVYRRCYSDYGLPGWTGAWLQCDFACMVSTPMFRRFVLPYLEREAAYNQGRVFYHWDGITTLTHTDDLMASKGLSCLSFVPGTGNGDHPDYLDIYEKLQKGGKSILVWGTPDQCKLMHTRLMPHKTVYQVHGTQTRKEAEDLLKWFKDNT